MAFKIYGNPACPECLEPIAPKAMAFSCGSCGHHIEPVRSCGGGGSLGGVACLTLLLFVLGAIANYESTNLSHRMRFAMSAQLQAAINRNAELARQLSLAREEARASEARDSANRARIEALRTELTRLARERGQTTESESQIIDGLLQRMVEIAGDGPYTPEQTRAFEAQIDRIAREGLSAAPVVGR